MSLTSENKHLISTSCNHQRLLQVNYNVPIIVLHGKKYIYIVILFFLHFYLVFKQLHMRFGSLQDTLLSRGGLGTGNSQYTFWHVYLIEFKFAQQSYLDIRSRQKSHECHALVRESKYRSFGVCKLVEDNDSVNTSEQNTKEK